MWLVISKGVHTSISIFLAVAIVMCIAGAWWRRHDRSLAGLMCVIILFCNTLLWDQVSRVNQTLRTVDWLTALTVCVLLALIGDDIRSNSDK